MFELNFDQPRVPGDLIREIVSLLDLEEFHCTYIREATNAREEMEVGLGVVEESRKRQESTRKMHEGNGIEAQEQKLEPIQIRESVDNKLYDVVVGQTTARGSIFALTDVAFPDLIHYDAATSAATSYKLSCSVGSIPTLTEDHQDLTKKGWNRTRNIDHMQQLQSLRQELLFLNYPWIAETELSNKEGVKGIDYESVTWEPIGSYSADREEDLRKNLKIMAEALDVADFSVGYVQVPQPNSTPVTDAIVIKDQQVILRMHDVPFRNGFYAPHVDVDAPHYVVSLPDQMKDRKGNLRDIIS